MIWKNDSKSGNVTLTVTQDLNQDAETTIEGAVTENEPKIHAAENIKTEVYDMFGNNITSADGTYNITKEPIYVVLEAESEDVRESDNIEVNNETGQVSVRCGNAIPGADVTLLARQQNAVGNPIYYIGQTKAGLSGAYAFDFTIKPDDICSIKVYSKGGSGVFNVGNERYEITVDYLLNGEPFNDYSKASGGDEITARANVKPRDGSQAGSLILYGVVTSDGIMEDSAMTEFYSADGTESAELSMKPESQEDLNTLRFMLWNDKMQPLMGAAGIKD